MTPDGGFAASAASDAALAAALFAVDPPGTGGLVLRAPPGQARDACIARIREALPQAAPFRRVPLRVPDGRLLGGLDLAATLEAGRPVAERGILVEADDGVVLLAMAERLEPAAAARLGLVLDAGHVVLERDGLARRLPTRFGVIALDEGVEPDERPPVALCERLAFHLDLAALGPAEALPPAPGREAIAAARERLPAIRTGDDALHALCETAALLGIASIRAPLLALRVARASAALDGDGALSERDVERAARLVLAPRATSWPTCESSPGERPAEAEPPSEAAPQADESAGPAPAPPENPLAERVLAATRAAIPPDLLAQLRLGEGPRSRPRTAGTAGARQGSTRRGRPTGVRSGEPRAGERLHLVETLRAAAPWQRLRSAEPASAPQRIAARIQVRRADFRVMRFEQRTEVTAVFAVDASGSTALQRLAEAKGAIELLLAECYVRRDRVALVAFRGRDAQLLLPPTRSLVRAKRSLAGLPGGGGTPLAAGIGAAADLAREVRRRGGTPLLVFLTDGRANVARDGTAGRPRAEADATAAARLVRADAVSALLVDTSPRPQASARQLAAEMGARYLPLPHADSAALCEAVRQTAPGRAAARIG